MMTCCHCGRKVVYCGPAQPHFSRAVTVQFEDTHELHEAIQLEDWQYVVPMYDGQLVLAMHLSLN